MQCIVASATGMNSWLYKVSSEVWTFNFVYISPGHAISVFLNRRAVARHRALASIIPGRERP